MSQLPAPLRDALEPLDPDSLVPVRWIYQVCGLDTSGEEERTAFRSDYTVQEVAELLGRSPDTVRRWIREGELRAYEFGREYRVTPRSLERFQEAKRNGESTTTEDARADLGSWRKHRSDG